MPEPKIHSVSRLLARTLAAAHGLTATTTESLRDDVLLPDAPPVLWQGSDVFVVPRRFRPLVCPDCGGGADDVDPDPLALRHLDERCEVLAEEEALRLADLAVLARVVRRGGNRRHRLAADVERLLLGERGVRLAVPAWTTVLATPEGGRRRAWRGHGHEPALVSESI